MSRIDDLIAKYCPDGVEYKILKDIAIMRRGASLTKANAKAGDIPVISGGKEPAFYHNEFNREGETITVAGSGAGAGYVQYWNKPIFVNDAFSIQVYDTILTKFVYFCLANMQQKISETKTSGGIPHVHISSIENFFIPVPPLPVQQEIVRILDSFSELEKELETREKQYEYYRNQLLSFGEGGKCAHNVKVMPLYEITIWDKKFNGIEKSMQERVIKYPYLLADELLAMKRSSGDVFLLSTGENVGWTTEDVAGNNLCVGEVVTIPWGKSRPVVECMKYYNGKFVTADNRIATSKDTSVLNNKYLFYWLQTKGGELDKFYRGAGIQHPNMKAVLTMQIPIPPLPEQERIVSILDKFDALVNDISVGLPAEIDARRKQYEYYREKLLTFNPIN